MKLPMNMIMHWSIQLGKGTKNSTHRVIEHIQRGGMVQGVKASARKQDRKNSQHQQIKTKNPVIAIRKIHRGKKGIEKGNYPWSSRVTRSVWVCPSSCFLFLLFALLLLSADPSLKLGSAQCFLCPSLNRESGQWKDEW